MNIFTISCYQILAKYSPKRTKLHSLKKNSLGSIPPNPLNKCVLRHALHGASRHANTPTFTKIF